MAVYGAYVSSTLGMMSQSHSLNTISSNLANINTGGYKANEVTTWYPDIRFAFNPDWEVTGPAYSLALVPLSFEGPTSVSYSDVLFRPACVRRVADSTADLTLAIDTRWRVR